MSFGFAVGHAGVNRQHAVGDTPAVAEIHRISGCASRRWFCHPTAIAILRPIRLVSVLGAAAGFFATGRVEQEVVSDATSPRIAVIAKARRRSIL